MLLFCVWTECADGDCPGGPEGPPDGHGGQGSPHTDAVVPREYQPRRGRPETGSRRTRRRKVPVSYDHFLYINKMKYFRILICGPEGINVYKNLESFKLQCTALMQVQIEHAHVCRYFTGRVDIHKPNSLIYTIDYNSILILIYEFDFLIREKYDCLYQQGNPYLFQSASPRGQENLRSVS